MKVHLAQAKGLGKERSVTRTQRELLHEELPDKIYGFSYSDVLNHNSGEEGSQSNEHLFSPCCPRVFAGALIYCNQLEPRGQGFFYCTITSLPPGT